MILSSGGVYQWVNFPLPVSFFVKWPIKMYSFENVIANCVLKKNVKENILQIGKNAAYSEKKDST